MKINTLLLEDKKPYILKAQGNNIFIAIKRDTSWEMMQFLQKHLILSIEDGNITQDQKTTLILDLLIELEKMDPTYNKQYLQWLVNQYIQRRFMLEDFQHVNNVLRDFDELKRFLPQQERDINRYTLNDLYVKVDSLKNESFKSRRKQKQEVKLQGAERIYDKQDCIIIELKTAEAAKYYAYNTKWCTSSEHTFQMYSEMGPIYVLIPKDPSLYERWGKIQIHFETNQIRYDDDSYVEDSVILAFPGFEYLVKQKIINGLNKVIAKQLDSVTFEQTLRSFGKYLNAMNTDDIEKRILETKDKAIIIPYSFIVKPGEWLEAEEYFIDSTFGLYYCVYRAHKEKPFATEYLNKIIKYNIDGSFGGQQVSSIIEQYITLMSGRSEKFEEAILDRLEKSGLDPTGLKILSHYITTLFKRYEQWIQFEYFVNKNSAVQYYKTYGGQSLYALYKCIVAYSRTINMSLKIVEERFISVLTDFNNMNITSLNKPFLSQSFENLNSIIEYYLNNAVVNVDNRSKIRKLCIDVNHKLIASF